MTNEAENPNPNEQESVDSADESVVEFLSPEEVDQLAGEETAAADNTDSISAETPGEPVDEVADLKSQLAEAEKRVLIAHADLDNFRRRNLRETQDQIKYAPGKLMTEILEAVDNLGRAVESFEKDQNGQGLCDGVKMVATQIGTILEKHGCTKIEALGQTYDPNLHQALQMQPSTEHEPNTVMMDLRSGFQLHDRVLRPSQVFVSTGAPQE